MSETGLENRSGLTPTVGFESHPLRHEILDLRFLIFDFALLMRRLLLRPFANWNASACKLRAGRP
jgi:hypothetical protein